MTNIIQERRAANAANMLPADEPFVVFLIGMRINKPWKVHRWLPVSMAMGRMIKELSTTPNSDLLNVESWFGRTTMMVQYWRSFEALENYAKHPDLAHRPAWAEFNKKIHSNGDVGIWHETYVVGEGRYECVYNNMPLFGLAKATESVPATGKRANAKGRLKAVSEEAAENAA